MGISDIFRRWRAKRIATEPPATTSHVYISQLQFSDGTKVDLTPDSVLVLTGPNNVGKSSALREIKDYLLDGSSRGPVVTSLSIELEGGPNDFVRDFRNAAPPGKLNNSVMIANSEYALSEIAGDYKKKFVGCRPMNLLVTHLGAAERLAVTSPANRMILDRRTQHPFLALEYDEASEERVSAIFERAFGAGLVLNTVAGESLFLHLKTSSTPPVTATTRQYANWLETQPRLDRQGDGMRSFAGTILSLLIFPRNVVLIDEPEAFLHPPQARRLAEAISKETPRNTQIVVATHNDEFVKALLDSSSGRILVGRIVRDRDTGRNKVSMLKQDQIISLWTDPILKHQMFYQPYSMTSP